MSAEEEGGRYQFLRTNELYETTPLTGYSFIASAKTIVEVVFWYGIIITMTIFTIFNVHDATINYLSKPTKTYVKAASSTENTSLADLNFLLNTTLIEFSQVNPTGLSYSDPVMLKMVVQQLACNVIVSSSYDFDTTANAYVLIEWIETLTNSWSLFGTKDVDHSSMKHLADATILGQWFDELETRGADLYDYLWKNRWTKTPSDYAYSPEYKSFIADALAYFDGPLKKRSKYTPYYLMLLKGLQDDTDPRKLLFDYLSAYIANSIEGREDYYYAEAYVVLFYKASEAIRDIVEPVFKDQNGSKYNSTAAELLKEMEMTVSEVLAAVYEGLNQMIHISIESDIDESPTPIYLLDWTYNAMSWKAPIDMNQAENSFMEAWQMLRLKVQLPEKSTHNHISIHSYLFIWIHHIIMAFQKYFEEIRNIETKIPEQFRPFFDENYAQWECGDPVISLNWEDRGDFDVARLLDFFQDLYASRTSLTLENERGSGIDMKPFRIYSITVKPTIQFYSNIASCEPNSQAHCLDECLAKSFEETCGCVPWVLHHIKSEPLCNTPCQDPNQPNVCKERCQRKLEHPCALSLYQFETVSRPMPRQSRLDRPVFEIEMRKAEVFNHPHFIEEYEMSMGDFIGQLGGVMEFWIGVNTIGLIHIFVYLFKRIYITQFERHKIADHDHKAPSTEVPGDYLTLAAEVAEMQHKFKHIDERLAQLEEKLEHATED